GESNVHQETIRQATDYRIHGPRRRYAGAGAPERPRHRRPRGTRSITNTTKLHNMPTPTATPHAASPASGDQWPANASSTPHTSNRDNEREVARDEREVARYAHAGHPPLRTRHIGGVQGRPQWRHDHASRNRPKGSGATTAR